MYNKKVKKSTKLFECINCDYVTTRFCQYDRHISTRKHQNNENTTKIQQNTTKKVPFCCECGKSYNHRASLYNHKKKCIYNECDSKLDLENELKNLDYKELILKLIKENHELKNTLVIENKELRTQINSLIPIVGNNNNNNITNNTINKNKFNINVFLNEQCKDALTMNEFIDKIKITMDNLMVTKNQGLAAGVSNIFIENMNKLSIHERPIHCTDVKRETMYIKCETENSLEGKPTTQWKKDVENIKIKHAFKKVGHIQQQGLKQWVEKHPDWEHKPNEQDEYLLLINKCTSDLTEDKKEEKILKKLCNEVYIKYE
jgi:hypothetical protein